MNLNAIYTYIPQFLGGLWVSLELTFIAAISGLILALPLALMAGSKFKILSIPINTFSFFFRGTPLLIQVYLLYFGMAQFAFIKQTPWIWAILKHAYWCALIAFTLNTCAYTLEIIKGAIKNTAKGEIEAGIACGMSKALVMRRIILPSALRRALPAYSNEVIFMLHGSAQASVITIMDLTGVAKKMYAQTFLPFEAFLTAAIFYLCLTFILVGLFSFFEKRYLSYLLTPKT